MKRTLITLSILLCSILAFTQPVVETSPTSFTNLIQKFMAGQNLVLPSYVDTTAANAQKGIDSCGALLFTYEGNKLWVRVCEATKRWQEVTTNVFPGVDSVIFRLGVMHVWSQGAETQYNFLGMVCNSIVTADHRRQVFYNCNGDSLYQNLYPYVSITGIFPIAITPVGQDSFAITDVGAGGSTSFQWAVLDSLNTPPVSPSTGDKYLVGTVPTGAYTGHANQVATFNGSAWTFQSALSGDLLRNTLLGIVDKYTGTTWIRQEAPPLHNGGDVYGTIQMGNVTGVDQDVSIIQNGTARATIDKTTKYMKMGSGTNILFPDKGSGIATDGVFYGDGNNASFNDGSGYNIWQSYTGRFKMLRSSNSQLQWLMTEAQNRIFSPVGIGEVIDGPNAASILDLKDTLGFMLPRMTTAQRLRRGGGYFTGHIVSGGSGYTNGSASGDFTNISGTGVAGAGTFSVSGGVVTSVSNYTPGRKYHVGDTLTTAIVGAGTGFRYVIDALDIRGMMVYDITDSMPYWHTSQVWKPVGSGTVSGGGITSLTGDVTASGTGSVAATLATVNSNVGSFTNANITVNAKGLITSASNGIVDTAFTPNLLIYTNTITPTGVLADAASFLAAMGAGGGDNNNDATINGYRITSGSGAGEVGLIEISVSHLIVIPEGLFRGNTEITGFVDLGGLLAAGSEIRQAAFKNSTLRFFLAANFGASSNMGDSAFYGCASLYSVRLPLWSATDNPTVFKNNPSLFDLVVLQSGTSVTSIETTNSFTAKVLANDVAISIAGKLNISDTAAMLASYQSAINSHTTNIALKLNLTDTAAMLSPYKTSYPRAAISLTTTGTGAATYTPATGVLNVPTPSGSATTDYALTVATSGQTAFTFTSVPATLSDYMIFRNGIPLEPTTDYTTSGNIVTLVSPSTVGDRIRYQRIK